MSAAALLLLAAEAEGLDDPVRTLKTLPVWGPTRPYSCPLCRLIAGHVSFLRPDRSAVFSTPGDAAWPPARRFDFVARVRRGPDEGRDTHLVRRA